MVSFKLGLGGGLVIAAGVLAFIFKDKISDFFSNISGGVEGAKEIGETVGILNENLQGNLTGIQDIVSGDIFKDIELPKIELPQDIDLFGGVNDFFKGIGGFFEGILNPVPEVQGAIQVIPESLDINSQINQILNPISTPDPIRTVLDTPESIIVPQGDELDLGGGLGFIGGTTTFGDNIIDSFTEALSIFPDLTASQLSNLLAENVGLTGSEFALINPEGEINISSAELENQVLLNSSGDFTGLTPEQIAQLLTGGNINNF